MAGPKRPQDRVLLSDAATAKFNEADLDRRISACPADDRNRTVKVAGEEVTILGDGDVVIAAITSCTNTSNPGHVLVAAGLLAREGRGKGPEGRSRG